MSELGEKAMLYTFWLLLALTLVLGLFVPGFYNFVVEMGKQPPTDPTYFEAFFYAGRHGAWAGTMAGVYSLVGGGIIAAVGRAVGAMDDASD